jgi:hypothetical protein
MKIVFMKIKMFAKPVAGLAVLATLTAGVIGAGEIHFQNVPIDVAVEQLARMTGGNFILSPRLTDTLNVGGKPVPKPTVTFQGEAAPGELLAKILKENRLTKIDDSATTVARIAMANEPVRKADASLLAGDTNAPIPLVAFSDVPLGVALENLAKSGKVEVVIDAKLSDSFHTSDGSLVSPPTASVRWENITARQAMLALAVNYDLNISKDEKSGAWRMEMKR